MSRDERIQRLFDEAVSLPSSKWEACVLRSTEDPDIRKEDLVEALTLVDLRDWPDLDALGVHIHDEVRQPGVLRGVRIRPDDQDAPVAEVRARGPDLLAVDDPVVAVAHGAAPQPGEVRPRARFAEELAPEHAVNCMIFSFLIESSLVPKKIIKILTLNYRVLHYANITTSL